jgi:hypothetical protein
LTAFTASLVEVSLAELSLDEVSLVGGALAAVFAAGGAAFTAAVALGAGLAVLRVAAALAGAFLSFAATFGSALAEGGGEDDVLPDGVSFVVDALAVDLVAGGRAGALGWLLGVPAVLLGMLFPT